MVSPGQIGEANYFAYNRQIIQITEDDLKNGIGHMCEKLMPLHINFDKLRKVGFSVISGSSSAKWLKATADGHNTVYISAGTNNYWIVQINGSPEKIRKVQYLHELQNFWFWAFEEFLQKKKTKEKQAAIPQPDSRIIRGKPIKAKNGPGGWETVGYQPVFEQPYYLTWDCMYCISTRPLCVWSLHEGRPLFQFEGKSWCFTWKLGQPSNLDEEKALQWFKSQLPTLQVYGKII
jgi:hypothetical protein